MPEWKPKRQFLRPLGLLEYSYAFQQKYLLPEMNKIIDEVKKTTGKPYEIIVVDFTTWDVHTTKENTSSRRKQ